MCLSFIVTRQQRWSPELKASSVQCTQQVIMPASQQGHGQKQQQQRQQQMMLQEQPGEQQSMELYSMQHTSVLMQQEAPLH